MISDVDEQSPDENTPSAAPLKKCWRCRKEYSSELPRCSYCQASGNQSAIVPKDPAQGLGLLIGSYILLLATSIAGAWLLFLVRADEAGEEVAAVITTIVAVVDSFAILVTISLNRSRLGLFPKDHLTWWPWFLSPFVLAGMLLGNVGYHRLLLDLLGVTEIFPTEPEHWAWSLIIVCIQPAIIEELYFREFMMNWLRTHMSIRSAIGISSAAFALAHLHAPLSIPYLFTVGIALGWFRWKSGTILLPMLLHFTHNFVVTEISNFPW
jgi:uncharacterized protein